MGRFAFPCSSPDDVEEHEDDDDGDYDDDGDVEKHDDDGVADGDMRSYLSPSSFAFSNKFLKGDESIMVLKMMFTVMIIIFTNIMIMITKLNLVRNVDQV